MVNHSFFDNFLSYQAIRLILLWISPRASNQLKGIVTILILYSVLFDVGNSFVTRILYPPHVRVNQTTSSASSYQSSNQASSGDTGHLKKDAEWLEGNGDFHYHFRGGHCEIHRFYSRQHWHNEQGNHAKRLHDELA